MSVGSATVNGTRISVKWVTSASRCSISRGTKPVRRTRASAITSFAGTEPDSGKTANTRKRKRHTSAWCSARRSRRRMPRTRGFGSRSPTVATGSRPVRLTTSKSPGRGPIPSSAQYAGIQTNWQEAFVVTLKSTSASADGDLSNQLLRSS